MTYSSDHYTNILGLFKSIFPTDDNDTFNFDRDLNDNWIKIDNLLGNALVGGIPIYSADITYSSTSIVRKVSTTQLYKSLVNDNKGNALTNTNYWGLLGDLSDIASISGKLTKAQGDGYYAALAGLATQLFSAADGTSGKQVVNISQFACSLGMPGWMKFPGGFTLQWGYLSNGTSGPRSVTLPLTYTTTLIPLVSSTLQDDGNDGDSLGIIFYNNSTIKILDDAAGRNWLTLGVI